MRLGVLLLAKLNLLHLEMLIKAGCDLFFGLQLILSLTFAKSETSYFPQPYYTLSPTIINLLACTELVTALCILKHSAAECGKIERK